MLKPERLDGANQYWCSNCQCKRDADRGCAFHKMPYLLTLQMMRFTFDPMTLNRIKLDNCFTFPLDLLDLTPYVSVSKKSHENPVIGADTKRSMNCEKCKDGCEDDYFMSSHQDEMHSEINCCTNSGQNRAKSEDGLTYGDRESRIGFPVDKNYHKTSDFHVNEVMDHCSESGKSETMDSGVNSNTDDRFVILFKYIF